MYLSGSKATRLTAVALVICGLSTAKLYAEGTTQDSVIDENLTQTAKVSIGKAADYLLKRTY